MIIVGIEGFYLLRKLPYFKGDMQNFPPQHFDKQCCEDIKTTKEEVKKTFTGADEQEVLQAWESWYSDYAPLTNDVLEYLQLVKTRSIRKFMGSL